MTTPTDLVLVPREKLNELLDHLYNPFEPDNQSRRYIELKAMIASAPSPWRDIESAPKDGTEILVAGVAYGKPYRVVATWGNESKNWLLFDPLMDEYAAESDGHTHWMPLPTPPRDSVQTRRER